MPFKQLVGIVFMVASGASTYVPYLLTRGSTRLTGAQLGAQHPERAWVRFVYPLTFIMMFFGIALLFFFVVMRQFTGVVFADSMFFVMGGLLGCVPLFNGVFALLTGVIPVNRRRQYFYVYDEDLTFSGGFILIAVGLFFVMAAAFAVLFW